MLQRGHLLQPAFSSHYSAQGLLGHSPPHVPEQHLLQQITRQAGFLAAVRRGRLVPVQESYVASVRTEQSDPERFGWAGERCLLSPDGTCAVLLDPSEDHSGLKILHLRGDGDQALQLAAATAAEAEPPIALGFSDSDAVLGVLQLRANPQGHRAIVWRAYHTRQEAWDAAAAIGFADSDTAFTSSVLFSSDDTLAACSLYEDNGMSHIFIIAMPGLHVKALTFPAEMGWVDLMWLPRRHTLLATTSSRLAAIDVSTVTSDSGATLLETHVQVTRVSDSLQFLAVASNRSYIGLQHLQLADTPARMRASTAASMCCRG